MVVPYESIAEVAAIVSKSLDPDQPILACACCGEVYATEMERLRDGVAVTGYQVPLRDLDILKLTPDQRVNYFDTAFTYRPVRSVYPPRCQATDTTDNSPDLYHLHKEFISETTADVEDHIATLCYRCHESVRARKIPRFSLADSDGAGGTFDYGDIRRLTPPGEAETLYPPLTIAESMAISLDRPYGVMIQVTQGGQGTGRHVLQTHMITFPHSGGDTLSRRMVNLPRPLEDLQKNIMCTFVGAGHFNQVKNSLLGALRNAVINETTLFHRLGLYKHVNRRFRTMNIPTLADIQNMNYRTLCELPHELQPQSGPDLTRNIVHGKQFTLTTSLHPYPHTSFLP